MQFPPVMIWSPVPFGWMIRVWVIPHNLIKFTRSSRILIILFYTHSFPHIDVSWRIRFAPLSFLHAIIFVNSQNKIYSLRVMPTFHENFSMTGENAGGGVLAFISFCFFFLEPEESFLFSLIVLYPPHLFALLWVPSLISEKCNSCQSRQYILFVRTRPWA